MSSRGRSAAPKPAKFLAHRNCWLLWPTARPAGIFCQNILASLCYAAAEASCPPTIQMTEAQQEGCEGRVERWHAGVRLSVRPCHLRKSPKPATGTLLFTGCRQEASTHHQMSRRADEMKAICDGFDRPQNPSRRQITGFGRSGGRSRSPTWPFHCGHHLQEVLVN